MVVVVGGGAVVAGIASDGFVDFPQRALRAFALTFLPSRTDLLPCRRAKSTLDNLIAVTLGPLGHL